MNKDQWKTGIVLTAWWIMTGKLCSSQNISGYEIWEVMTIKAHHLISSLQHKVGTFKTTHQVYFFKKDGGGS